MFLFAASEDGGIINKKNGFHFLLILTQVSYVLIWDGNEPGSGGVGQILNPADP